MGRATRVLAGRKGSNRKTLMPGNPPPEGILANGERRFSISRLPGTGASKALIELFAAGNVLNACRQFSDYGQRGKHYCGGKRAARCACELLGLFSRWRSYHPHYAARGIGMAGLEKVMCCALLCSHHCAYPDRALA